MKVIGLTDPAQKYGDQQYIAIVDHSELARLSDKAGYQDKLPRLEIGAEFDLGNGYRFREDIKSACAAMATAMEKFEKARTTMAAFAALIAAQESAK